MLPSLIAHVGRSRVLKSGVGSFWRVFDAVDYFLMRCLAVVFGIVLFFLYFPLWRGPKAELRDWLNRD